MIYIISISYIFICFISSHILIFTPVHNRERFTPVHNRERFTPVHNRERFTLVHNRERFTPFRNVKNMFSGIFFGFDI